MHVKLSKTILKTRLGFHEFRELVLRLPIFQENCPTHS